jgi:3',5'-cyclic AMP phosphodiesterase CpdA
MQAFAGCGVDLFLSGHLHRTRSGNTAARYSIDGFAALVVQAGTATSTRGRGEENSFNVLRLQPDRVEIERHAWGEEHLDYRAVERFAYAREGESWHEVPRV